MFQPRRHRLPRDRVQDLHHLSHLHRARRRAPSSGLQEEDVDNRSPRVFDEGLPYLTIAVVAVGALLDGGRPDVDEAPLDARDRPWFRLDKALRPEQRGPVNLTRNPLHALDRGKCSRRRRVAFIGGDEQIETSGLLARGPVDLASEDVGEDRDERHREHHERVHSQRQPCSEAMGQRVGESQPEGEPVRDNPPEPPLELLLQLGQQDDRREREQHALEHERDDFARAEELPVQERVSEDAPRQRAARG